jgi:hypothetical protein
MYQTVDVEAEVDVTVTEVLIEFGKMLEEVGSDLPVRRTFLPLVDFAMRLLAQIPIAAIAQCKGSQRAEIVHRLQAEAERWDTIIPDADT